jgi:ribosome biogenesis GTPase A
MNINWYPGHMAKTRRLLEENVKLVDIIIELLDARIPASSTNPVFDNLFNNKKRIKVMNKHDLSDPETSEKWKKHFEEKEISCIFVDSLKGRGFNKLYSEIENSLQEKFERDREKGLLRRPVRAMVVGIPNVGKSTFINVLTKKKAARTGNKPGVTKNKQWIKISPKLHLLDTPGILWPKFEDEKTGINLAVTGSIKDEITDAVELVAYLYEFLKKEYPGTIEKRYSIREEGTDTRVVLNGIASARGFLMGGGVPDIDKAAATVLDEFRKGLLGGISLEKPGKNAK